ncbi:MAG: SEC-C domain-containing protein, partial [Candidatus Omnitrophica bacterium]|nr:SEC-C domain-containing protein [Candidatus Omnitrophota bacterium]
VQEAYTAREQELGVEQLRMLERRILLDFIDVKWKDHLYAMDALREGIGLRAYGQRDPKVEYAHEAFGMFEEMVARIKEEAVEFLFKVRAAREEPSPRGVFNAAAAQLLHPESERFLAPPIPAAPTGLPEGMGLPFGGGFRRGAPPPPQSEPSVPVRRAEPKIGRNDPCHCGSGKKYKKCHGQNA